MFRYFLSVLLSFVLFTAAAQDANPYFNIIPAPVSLKKTEGTFTFSMETVVQADTPSNKAVAFLTSYLTENWGYHKINVTDISVTNNVLRLTSIGADGLPEGGYHISITPQSVTITGKGAGLFYGIQTLIQLMPEKGAIGKLPCLEIDDYPRFAYRGLMLDVSRHFFSVEFVKKYIDLMAMYKLNNFHWHLTDDQGWRIEIKKYPNLTLIGSKRARTSIGNFHDFSPMQYDNTPYGGYYTQDDIREVVKYASDRYINIVPEIEMPGHSEAAVAAYPQLSCDPTKKYKVAETWGGFPDVFCPTEYTFGFLEDVLTEVMNLFPGKLIHIGGDEVSKEAWRNSEFCQKLIKKLKLKNEEGLQSYFVQRIEKFVNSKGRSIIGWDEILQGGLAPNATVMSWTGEAGGIAAAQQHHKVIMTPSSAGFYFDHAQGISSYEPLGIGGYSPMKKTYAYNPVPAVLTPDQQPYIMGVQANLWTEYITTDNKVEYMLLPRLLALAEVAWTPIANKNYMDFVGTRVPVHLGKLDAEKLDFRVSAARGATDTIMVGSTFNFDLKSPVAGAKIYYTVDGYVPRETDQEYKAPLNIIVPDSSSRELQTIVITPSGKRSAVTHTIMNNMPPLAAFDYKGNAPGLKYRVYPGSFTGTDELDDAKLIDSGIAKNFYTSAFKKNSRNFGVIYDGYIRVDSDGKYLFSTVSADGSTLLIDDNLVVDNDGKHSTFEHGGEVLLQKGYHKLTVKYFFAGAASTLRVYMTMPGRFKTELPPDIIFN